MKTARLLLVIPLPDQSLHLAQIEALAARIKELEARQEAARKAAKKSGVQTSKRR